MANGDNNLYDSDLQKEIIEDAIDHYKCLIEKNGDASSIPHKHCVRLEAQEVTDFSSQYGSENSFSYVASNLAGKTSVFPSYGDFINACVFRTYGPWWKIAPSGVKRYRGTPASFISVDFIEVYFAEPLYPVSIEVYETYNPGSIVRILACDNAGGTSTDSGIIKWVTLWEGSPCPCMKPQIFSPPLKQVDFATNFIRLELNHDGQDYYTELDGIRLIGKKDKLGMSNDIHDKGSSAHALENEEKLLNKLETLNIGHNESGSEDLMECYVTVMPEEIIQLLLSYLDTRDICRLSQTCRILRDECYNPLLYTDLNLQPYWTQVVSSTFKSLNSRCSRLRRLNISWCGKGGSISIQSLQEFLQSCDNLETLELASCPIISQSAFSAIVSSCSYLTELSIQSCTWILDFTVFRRIPMKNLKRLNLYRTRIEDVSLICLFKSSMNLEHLNIGSCYKLNPSINRIIKEIGMHCKKLKSIDLWRMKSLDHEGLSHLHNCLMLEDIDLGWCTALKSDKCCFLRLVHECRKLKKLYLTANRTVNDDDIIAVTNCCPLMEQLDILGTREVTKQTIVSLLEKCPHMKMLDVSFCVGISFSDVLAWRALFPHVSIKKSFQNVSELPGDQRNTGKS